MRITTFVILGLLLCTQVRAQDVTAYHLRTPSADEYVTRIAEIAGQQADQEVWPTRTLYPNLTNALFWRFPDLSAVDYEQILATYDAMGIGQDGTFWKRGQWVEAILAAWLRQTQPDLRGSSELTFADFRIGVTPRDFDGDGQDEFVLDVIKGERTDRYDCRYQADYVNYLVVQYTGSGYEFVESPLPWEGYGTDSAVTNFGEGGQVDYGFEDINADGLPEWLVLRGGETFGGPGMGYENTGRLYVLGWRDGRLVDLAATGNEREYPYSITAYGEDAGVCQGAVPRDITWEFSNLDGDASQEILQHQVYLDNWRCLARHTRILDWDGAQDRYVQIDERHDFPEDSQNCARRQAEEAMWTGDYERALERYERALNLPPFIDPDETDVEGDELWRHYARDRRLTYDEYHIARMALAYQLTGQPEKAHEILDPLRDQAFTYEPVRYLVEALAAAQDTPMGACMAAYTSAATHFDSDSGYYLLGETQEQYYDTYVRYSPARVGCDVASLIAAELQTRSFTADRSPEDYVNDFGVGARRAIHADLNGDGREEWLIWPQVMLAPFFFTLDETGTYAVTTPAIDPFGRADKIYLWPLPDDAGIAVAYLQSARARTFPEPWACLYDSTCGIGGSGAECSPDGYMALTMWRMEGDVLVTMLYDEDVCVTDFAALFPGGEASATIDGGAFNWSDGRSTPLRYEWDSESQTFARFDALAESTATPTPIPTPEPQYWSVNQALAAGDYAAALTLLDDSIAYEQSADLDRPDLLYAYRFHRAFILEAIGRPDEALAEYIALYENAPDSAWGSMAALHLEPVA
ncbi:MAG: hypothetical protein IT320_16710 [Anaerolineae bacterium]|nr:hypothetical protein [Anaerolineae bacterium]